MNIVLSYYVLFHCFKCNKRIRHSVFPRQRAENDIVGHKALSVIAEEGIFLVCVCVKECTVRDLKSI